MISNSKEPKSSAASNVLASFFKSMMETCSAAVGVEPGLGDKDNNTQLAQDQSLMSPSFRNLLEPTSTQIPALPRVHQSK
eukprot:2716959-Amphidinium_carterae.1